MYRRFTTIAGGSQKLSAVNQAEMRMKKIRYTEENNWTKLIQKIRSSFGDDSLYFTISPFKKHKPLLQTYPVSTFAHDNIEHLESWCDLMNGKLQSGNIDAIAVIVRVFLPEKVVVDGKIGKIEIPKKDLYHFFVSKDNILLFNETETYEAQNTDAFTGAQIQHESGIVYRSSEELYKNITNETI